MSGLTREQIEALRGQIGNDFDGAITLSDKHMNALCNMALRSLASPSATAATSGPTFSELSAARWAITQMHRTDKWDNDDIKRVQEALGAVLRIAAAPAPAPAPSATKAPTVTILADRYLQLIRLDDGAKYNAVADAVQEIANAAQDAFRAAGIEPGEWDSDDIVKDVARGIVTDIVRLTVELKRTAPRVEAERKLPDLDDEVKWILGRPCFTIIEIAHVMRTRGFDIPKKAEEEQAAVAYWSLQMYTKYGKDWRKLAVDELNAMPKVDGPSMKPNEGGK